MSLNECPDGSYLPLVALPQLPDEESCGAHPPADRRTMEIRAGQAYTSALPREE